MNAREMQVAFLQIMESHADYEKAPILSEDIQYYLNEASNVLFDERWQQFEQNQRITDDLKPFVVKESALAVTHTAPGYTTSALIDTGIFATDHLYLLNTQAEIYVANSGNFDYELDPGSAGPPIILPFRKPNTAPAYTDYTARTTKVRIRQHDDIRILQQDPFNKSQADDLLGTISQVGVNIYTDPTFIVNQVIVDYIKTPASITIDTVPANGTDSEFPEYLHRNLVERAVALFLQQQPRGN